MLCSKCGKEITDYSVFCYSCGSKVEIKGKQDIVTETPSSIVHTEITPTLKNSSEKIIDEESYQPVSTPSSKINKKFKVETQQSTFMISSSSGNIYKKRKNISNVYKSVVTSKLVVGTLLTFSSLIIFIISFSPDDEERGAQIFWAIIILIVGIFFLKIWYLNKGRKIELNRDGFIYNDKKSEKIIEWRDIEEIYQVEVCRKKTSYLLLLINPIYYLILSLSKDYEYTIKTKDGRILTIDRKIKYYKELVDIIKSNIYELVYSKLMNIYDENGDIQFGDFIINKRGINKNGKDIILWNDVKDIETRLGHVRINQKKKLMSWGTTEELKVSNYFVIIPIINQIIKGEI